MWDLRLTETGNHICMVRLAGRWQVSHWETVYLFSISLRDCRWALFFASPIHGYGNVSYTHLAPPPDYYSMMRELHKIGNNLNQIAQKAHVLNVIDVQRYDQEVWLSLIHI